MVIRNGDSGRWRRPAEAAQELGVSVKALRVYERAGLIEPDRSAKSWREYSPACMSRLRRILVMKSMGLTLAEISQVIDRPGSDLGKLLEAQAQVIIDIIEKERAKLRTIRAGQRRLAADPEAQLPSTLLQPVAQPPDAGRVADIIHALASDNNFKGGDRSTARFAENEYENEISEIIAEAGRLAATRAATHSSEAVALARRWQATCDALSAEGELPSGDAAQDLADDIRLNPSIAPALRFLREAALDLAQRSEGNAS